VGNASYGPGPKRVHAIQLELFRLFQFLVPAAWCDREEKYETACHCYYDYHCAGFQPGFGEDGCTSENMAKLVASSNAMAESPGKAAMMKEMGAANAAMAKGDMRGACKSYMRAQQMSGQKG
jgi:hypothetical protein